MDALERAYMEKGAGRIYWCGYGRDIPPKVQRFLEKLISLEEMLFMFQQMDLTKRC